MEKLIEKQLIEIKEQFKNSHNFFKLIPYQEAHDPVFKKSTNGSFEKIYRYFFKPSQPQECVDNHPETMFYHLGIYHDKAYCLKCKTQWSENVDGAY